MTGELTGPVRPTAEDGAPDAYVVARIGICEDDPAIRRVLTEGLRMAGHDVVAAHDGAEAMRLFGAAEALDVLILDIGLPDADGRDVPGPARRRGQKALVLVLTAYDALHDRLSGFNAGSDDYVTKPFAIKEILVRVAAVVRRTAPSPVGRGRRHEGALPGPEPALVTETAEVPLSPTEYRILAAIAGRPDEVVRRRAVVAAAWPDGAVVSENTVDTYIRRVRTKLEQAGSPRMLHTVRGGGFALEGSDARPSQGDLDVGPGVVVFEDIAAGRRMSETVTALVDLARAAGGDVRWERARPAAASWCACRAGDPQPTSAGTLCHAV